MPDASDSGVLDEGLGRLAHAGPEFAGGLSERPDPLFLHAAARASATLG